MFLSVPHVDAKSNTMIFYDLMKTYDKNIRPYYLQKPVTVTIDMFMDEVLHIFYADFEFFRNSFLGFLIISF